MIQFYRCPYTLCGWESSHVTHDDGSLWTDWVRHFERSHLGKPDLVYLTEDGEEHVARPHSINVPRYYTGRPRAEPLPH